MLEEHARPGKAHHGTDLLAALALVTVDRTFCAGWLLGAKAAALKSDFGVIVQVLAVRAKAVGRTVLLSTVTLDHQDQSSPLPVQPGILERPRRCGGTLFVERPSHAW